MCIDTNDAEYNELKGNAAWSSIFLEIDMEKNKNYLKLNEILALGPSMSVLMEGYQIKDEVTKICKKKLIN